MTDYDLLRDYLKKQTLPEFVLSFEQIEEIIDAALPRADFVSIHCPKTPETVGMFNAARLARMKPSIWTPVRRNSNCSITSSPAMRIPTRGSLVTREAHPHRRFVSR